MERAPDKKTWMTLVALTFIVAFAFQGSRGLWEPDEGRYVRCAYEMQKTGNWITPTLNYEPHVTKPPATYWLIATGLSIFGRNEWGARVFHGLAFALTAILVGLLGKRIWGDLTGLLACLIYATSVLPFATGNIITTDTILVFFETLAVVCFWMSVTTRNNVFTSSLWALAMWLFFGGAFLTKGPPGLLPLAAIVPYMLIARKKKRLPAYVTVVGIIIFAASSLWWYIEIVRQQDGLLAYFLESEVIGRIVTGEHRRNPGWFGPFKIYLPVLTAGALPWACFWPALLMRSRPRITSPDWWRDLRDRPVALFLLLWFGAPLLILSLASSRLQLYVLPLFAPLALVTARGLCIHFPEKVSKALRLRGKPGVAVAALVLILLGSKLVAAHIPLKRDSRAMWNGIHESIEQKVGNTPYEILVLGDYDGLAFYGDTNVERLTTRQRSIPSFIPDEQLDEEYDELRSCHYAHIFLVRERHARIIFPELNKRGIGYSVEEAPFEHQLIFCGCPTSEDNTVIRLGALGDTGTGDAYQAMVSAALYHIDQNTSLDAVLMLGDNIYRWEGEDKIAETYKECFELPYASLLANEVPFYAALGNHDYRHGQMDYQIHYPLFHMNGKRYYSKIFGDNMVEVFFLDSNTIKDDRKQIEWLKQALKKSTASWKVIAMHHPIYSTARTYPTDRSMIQLLEPIFSDNGVDIVLYGHNHVYERLYPIRGIQYITAGSGGQLRKGDLVPDSPQRAAGNDVENVGIVFEFRRDRCHLTAYGLNDTIIDSAEIERVSTGAAAEARTEHSVEPALGLVPAG